MTATATEPYGDDIDESSDKFTEMRARANKASKLEHENSALTGEVEKLRRQVAFTSAGLALTDKQQAALLAAHGDAELTADALKATAVELGFAQASQQETEDDQRRQQAAEAQAKVGQAQAGSTPPDPIPDTNTQAKAAEQAGDWEKARRLKSQALTAALLA